MGLLLKVKNKTVDFFNDFSFNLRYDSIASSFGFSYYYDPNNLENKQISEILKFNEVQLYYNEQLLITGNIINQGFSQSSAKQLARFGGYSKTGVLEDCQIPVSLYPLQFDKLNLYEIASKLTKPFNIEILIDISVRDRMSKIFDTSTASERSSIKDFLTDLAVQKDIIITHTRRGELMFTDAKTIGNTIIDFDLTEGTENVNTIATNFNIDYDGQSMHSEITVQKQASIDGGNAGEYTIKNPYVTNYFKPRVIIQSSGDDNDTILMARRELGNEISNIKLSFDINTWLIDGIIIRPNNLISLIAPELGIFKRTLFFIESVNFSGDNVSETATVNCVLPEVYNKNEVKSIF